MATSGFQSFSRPMTSESQSPIVAKYDENFTSKIPPVTVTEIPMTDLSAEKAMPPPRVTNSVRRSQQFRRPVIKTKPKAGNRFAKWCRDQSPVVKALLVTFFTGIPFVVLFLLGLFVFPNTTVGPPTLGATFANLSWWLLISWFSFLLLLGFGLLVASTLAWLCSIHNSLTRFANVARNISVRLTFFLWAVVGYSTVQSIFDTSLGDATADNWVKQLRLAFIFLMITFACILVQGILLQLIAIQYVQGYIGPRSQRAFNELETIKELNALVDPHVKSNDIGIVAKVLRKVFMPIDSDDLYRRISRGEGDEDMCNEYAGDIWSKIARGKAYLELHDISQQLLNMNRNPELGQELFYRLDESLDGQVTEEELTKMVQQTGLQLKQRALSLRGIRKLLGSLECALFIFVIGVIAYVYIQFFAKSFAASAGELWKGILALSFAFNGAVLEFVNSCVFVFGKHPYDVGDYVEVKTKKLIVNKIYLTHTNFEEVSDPEERGIVVQISHAAMMAEPITNWSRTLDTVTTKRKTKDAESSEKDKAEKALVKEKEAEEKELRQLKAATYREHTNTNMI